SLPAGEKATITVYALPFVSRKAREVFFNHRPCQTAAVAPDILCRGYGLKYVKCQSDTDIDNSCHIYLVAGAGILSPAAVENKKIINCHPGIIPAARGLDSFKWSILNMVPVGNTLHYIDKGVDCGEIITVLPTPVFSTDTLETLARRHYERELQLLSGYRYHLAHPQNDFAALACRNATMRMPIATEKQMVDLFNQYKERFAL
ncbi:MAG: formyltransferase family protein, partial [Oscillospiraceae bacterium]